MAASTMSRMSMAMLVLLGLAWGSSFMFIKIAVESVSPALVMCARCLIGAGLLWLVALATVPSGERRLTAPLHLRLALLGALTAIPFFLIAWGEQYVDSNLAGIINATTPLWSVMIASRWDREHPSGVLRFVGVAVGFAGVVGLILSTGDDSSGDTVTAALVGMAIAALIYAISGVFTRVSLRSVHPVMTGAWSILWATVFLLPPAVVGLDRATFTFDAVASIVALGVFGTGLGFFLYFRLLADVGAARASLVTYVMPPVAVFYGVVFLDERVGIAALAAMVCILVGVWIGSLGGRPRDIVEPAH